MSVDNKKWEIGVAVPISNYNFRYKNRFSGSGDYDSSGDVISNVSLSTDAGEQDIGGIFNPSKYSEYISVKNSSGEVVSKEISSVSSSSITLSTSLSNSFNENGLDLQGYGKYMPGGWSGGIREKSVGSSDNFSVGLTFDKADLIQDISSDYIYVDNYYRLFADVKTGTYNSSWEFGVRGDVDFLTVSGDTSSYTFKYDSKILSSSGNFNSIFIDRGLFSSIGLEFAYNPEVDIDISGDSENGYYEFEDWPSMGSVSWENRSKQSTLEKLNSGISLYDPSGKGERNQKLTVSASFTKAPLSLFNKLREFIRVQKNGFELNLHPYGYDELPKTITGYMFIDNVSRSSWNLGLVDFDFTFKEK